MKTKPSPQTTNDPKQDKEALKTDLPLSEKDEVKQAEKQTAKTLQKKA